MAAWAVALGLFLILVAAATSEGSTGGAALPPPVPEAPANDGAATSTAFLRSMPMRRATWYGPGLYGKRTACGVRLRRSTLGVAHRRLPCGTMLTFYRAGRYLTLPVIDRGPFARGVQFDLTAAAASQLGLERTGSVRVSI